MNRLDPRYADCLRGKDIITPRNPEKDPQRVQRSGRASSGTRLAKKLAKRVVVTKKGRWW
jgi:hypothetical protein